MPLKIMDLNSIAKYEYVHIIIRTPTRRPPPSPPLYGLHPAPTDYTKPLHKPLRSHSEAPSIPEPETHSKGYAYVYKEIETHVEVYRKTYARC